MWQVDSPFFWLAAIRDRKTLFRQFITNMIINLLGSPKSSRRSFKARPNVKGNKASRMLQNRPGSINCEI